MLAAVGLSDLVSLSMPEDVSQLFYWGTQGQSRPVPASLRLTEPAPLRFFLSALLLAYTFLSGSSSPGHAQNSGRGRIPGAHNPGYTSSSWGSDGLKNRVFFTFVFVEMMAWFWTWVTLREERDTLVERVRRERGRLHGE